MFFTAIEHDFSTFTCFTFVLVNSPLMMQIFETKRIYIQVTGIQKGNEV